LWLEVAEFMQRQSIQQPSVALCFFKTKKERNSKSALQIRNELSKKKNANMRARGCSEEKRERRMRGRERERDRGRDRGSERGREQGRREEERNEERQEEKSEKNTEREEEREETSDVQRERGHQMRPSRTLHTHTHTR